VGVGAGLGMGGGLRSRCAQDAFGVAGEAWRVRGTGVSAKRSATVRRPRGPGRRCRADRRRGLPMWRLRVTVMVS